MRAARACVVGLAALVAVSVDAQQSPPDGRALVERLVVRQRDREALLDSIAYDVVERREERDAEGVVTKVERRRFEVFHVAGRPVRRLVSENGEPLSPARRAREDRRVRELAEALRAGDVVTEQPGVRLSALLEHYDVELEDREPGDEGTLLVFGIRPRAGSTEAPPRWLRNVEGRLWVDEDEEELARLVLRNTKGIRFALGIGATVSALGFELRHAKVKEGLWLPRQLVTEARGRRFPWRRFHVRRSVTWEAFRSFEVTTEERIDRP